MIKRNKVNRIVSILAEHGCFQQCGAAQASPQMLRTGSFSLDSNRKSAPKNAPSSVNASYSPELSTSNVSILTLPNPKSSTPLYCRKASPIAKTAPKPNASNGSAGNSKLPPRSSSNRPISGSHYTGCFLVAKGKPAKAPATKKAPSSMVRTDPSLCIVWYNPSIILFKFLRR